MVQMGNREQMVMMELMVSTASLRNSKSKMDTGSSLMIISKHGHNLEKLQQTADLMERMEIIFSRECPLKMALFASF